MKCTCLTQNDHPSHGHMDHCYWSQDQPGTVLAFRNEIGQPVVVDQATAMAGERPYRAHQLLLAGYSWDAIAIQEGYANPAAAKYDVQRYKTEGERLVTLHTRQQQLELEVARLDAVQQAFWDDAVNKKHLPSAKMVLDSISLRAKLMGLHTLAESDDDANEDARTVIIPSNDDYQASLERLTEG